MQPIRRMRRTIALIACALGVGALATACDEGYGGYYQSDYYAGYPNDYPYYYGYNPYPYGYTRFDVVVRPGFRGERRFEHERPRSFSRGPVAPPPGGRRRF